MLKSKVKRCLGNKYLSPIKHLKVSIQIGVTMNQEFKPDKGPVIDIDKQKLSTTLKRIVPIVVVILLVIILLFKGVYILENKENGVVLRFGQLQSVQNTPGIHFKVPFADTVNKVDVRTIYNMEYGFRTEKRADVGSVAVYEDQEEESKVIVDGANNNASIALIELIIQYRIKDPVDFLFKVDDVEGTLNLALEDIIRTSMQSFTLDEAKTQKELIDKAIKPRLQKKIDDYEAGIEIVLVGTQNVQFLPSVEAAYQQKENANQYKNGKKEDAEKYYNTIIPKANAEAIRLVEEANAYKARTLANANAGVAEFDALYARYLENKDILKERYYVEAMQAFIRNNKLIVDAGQVTPVHKFYNFDENAIKQAVTKTKVKETKDKETKGNQQEGVGQ